MPYINIARLMANHRAARRANATIRRLRREMRRLRRLIQNAESHRDYLFGRIAYVSRQRDDARDMLQNEREHRLRLGHLLDVELDRRFGGWFGQ